VRRSSWEPRPANSAANQRVPSRQSVSIAGASAAFNARFAARIDGDFTGTTDEIIQWASCKWGFDEDITRARAVAESFWQQSASGDVTSNGSTCAQIGKSAPCAESYGLLQVRFTAHAGTYPRAAESTAFNVDYTLANTRACFEGDLTWLNTVEHNGTYSAGDLWGCIGTWFSGRWYVGSQDYISRVQGHLASKPWLRPGF
jgi:autotransporter family porin